jgi:hypothetical protein
MLTEKEMALLGGRAGPGPWDTLDLPRGGNGQSAKGGRRSVVTSDLVGAYRGDNHGHRQFSYAFNAYLFMV